MNALSKLEGMINNAFLNNKGEVLDALNHIRDDVAELQASNGIPNDKREQRCQAVAGNGEGKVPTTTLDEKRVSREAIRPPGSGEDELEYWRGNAMHYQGLCVLLEDEIDSYILAIEAKNLAMKKLKSELQADKERMDWLEAAPYCFRPIQKPDHFGDSSGCISQKLESKLIHAESPFAGAFSKDHQSALSSIATNL